MDEHDSVVAIRLANRDSARLVLERLSQDSLKALMRWYLHPNGGRQGRIVLERAPIFDAIIDALMESTAQSFQEEAAESASRPSFMRPQLTSIESLGATFGAGLCLGADLRGRLESEIPFEFAVDLGDVLSELAAFDLLESQSEESWPHPLEVVSRLALFEPAIHLVLKALRNMELRGFAGPRRHGPLRLCFFAGMLASGIRLPEIVEPTGIEHAPF